MLKMKYSQQYSEEVSIMVYVYAQVFNRVLGVFQEFSSSNRETSVVGVLEECDSFLGCILLRAVCVGPVNMWCVFVLIDFKYPSTHKVFFKEARIFMINNRVVCFKFP